MPLRSEPRLTRIIVITTTATGVTARNPFITKFIWISNKTTRRTNAHDNSGLQVGDPRRKIPDLALFTTSSTLPSIINSQLLSSFHIEFEPHTSLSILCRGGEYMRKDAVVRREIG